MSLHQLGDAQRAPLFFSHLSFTIDYSAPSALVSPFSRYPSCAQAFFSSAIGHTAYVRVAHHDRGMGIGIGVVFFFFFFFLERECLLGTNATKGDLLTLACFVFMGV